MSWSASLFRTILTISLLGVLTCSGHLYPTPAPVPPISIVIMGFNDLHGALQPETYPNARGEPVPWGGMRTLASHLAALREYHGEGLVVVDAGDTEQGTLESSLDEGRTMIALENFLGVDVAALGNHSFDFGPADPETGTGELHGALYHRLSEARFPILAANVFLERNEQRLPLPGLGARALLEVSGVRLGFVGLLTPETKVTTRARLVSDVVFEDMGMALRREAAALRAEGAEAIIAVVHAGVTCLPEEAQPTPLETVGTWRRDQPEAHCAEPGELATLLATLPPGLIDAVVSGHIHRPAHHFINSIPVIQSSSNGRDYHLLHLYFDQRTRRFLPSATLIEGPIQVATDTQLEPLGALPERLRLRMSPPAPAITALIAQALERTERHRSTVLTHLAEPLPHAKWGVSPLGDLVCDAIREATGAEIALLNAGAIRTSWPAGPITYDQLYRTLPFENEVVLLDLSGEELRRLLVTAYSGIKGLFPSSGLLLRVLYPGEGVPWVDLDRDGQPQPWEQDRVLEVRLSTGEPLVPGRRYLVATIDFLVEGGDYTRAALSSLTADRIRTGVEKSLRRVVEEYVRNLPSRTLLGSRVIPNPPRLSLIPAPSAQSATTPRP